MPAGRALHAAIHAVVMLALAAPVLPRWWLVIPLVTAAHLWVDGLKMMHGPERGPLSLAAFFADQAAHVGILLLAGLLTGLPFNQRVIYGSAAVTAVMYYAIPYLAAAVAGSIVVYQVAVAFQTRSDPLELLHPVQRALGVAERALALSVVLFLAPIWWWAAAVSTALHVGANHGRGARWLESISGLLLVVLLGLAFR